MRVGHGMITAALAGLFAACAGPVGGVGGGQAQTETPTHETVCAARCACAGCSAEDEALCSAEQEAAGERAEQAQCQDELTAYTECVRLEGRCVDGQHVTDACDVHAAALSRCLDAADPSCPTVDNGICDELQGTGRCPAGTDAADCRPRCPYTGDGVCDEPHGTGRCPAGTDTADCGSFCPSTNDGICDEPEGTRRCAEGTDAGDCNRSSECDILRDCGDVSTGCTACAIEKGCSDELDACSSDDACIAFTQCAVTCEDDDDLCLGDCEARHPAGAALFTTYMTCVTCDYCYISCGGALSC
ncbi:latent transforming growth factor beta-binding protein [Sorangium sp. So ce1036]|uniref:latent transforming growth factor beta-binding protein n=1 Tax=Sorangium sp. So ce1036 TaxID=3133328 RepID=UPI003F06345F